METAKVMLPPRTIYPVDLPAVRAEVAILFWLSRFLTDRPN